MNVPLAELRSVTAGYGRSRVLISVNMQVTAGEVVALVGRNGEGKSTLLRTVRGLVSPLEGMVLIKDRPVHSLQPDSLARTVGFLSPSLPQAHVTADEIIELSSFGRFHSLQALVAAERPGVFVEVFALGQCFMDALSSGQQRKILLLALVAQGADLLLMDEPELHLDLPSLQSLYTLIRAEVARGKGVVLSTHNLETIRTVPDRLYLVKDHSLREVPRSEETFRRLQQGS